ncbi:uncharacterized protein LOC113295844 [Papaver somniferum]|uniref:uncharacterized protein LOC113295844 n=1 Tax=Papaver somniferum TaxID=3469 RepID=UPI000E6F71CD|nr:uncharacterized protein LOC113295844 [Papaver somniferum]
MRAALLWTINDFPAYANLLGWSTKGYLAFPCCHKDTSSVRLRNGRKNVYLGHRRFLPIGHRLRSNLSSFNGRREHDSAPKPLSGEDVLRQFRGYHQITFGKEGHDVCGDKIRRDDNELPYNCKKISIFFELTYWKDLLLRHNIDVMHTEKNNIESWIGTLLNIEGKTKDNLNAREDLKVLGIRGPLHPEALGNNKFYLPPAKYTLSLAERRNIFQFLRDIKVPDSYSSNISRHVQVQECKIPGLKSHDWHVLMQQLFPVAVRGILHDDVTRVLVEFSDFYTQLCSKTLRIEDLEALKKMYLTLCKMEMIFPPSFFDIMTHLPVHLAGEAIIAGPVHYRWMYPIERYLYTLKKYVRNKSQPEGSIAQGYLADECLTFCSRYLSAEINTKFNQIGRNSNGDGATTSIHESPIFEDAGRSLGKPIFRTLSDNEWEEARMYMLSNCDEIIPFIEKHKQTIRDKYGRKIRDNELEHWHAKMFGGWFENHVCEMKRDGEIVKKDIEILSYGPKKSVSCYKGYIVNGFRFHTIDHEKNRNTQNNGVCVNVQTSNKDSIESIDYYGRLDEVVALQYREGNQVVLLNCHWCDINETRKKQRDAFGFTSLNFTRTIAKNQPFMLAKQAHQARDHYSLGSPEVELIQEDSSHTDNVTSAAEIVQDFESWTRNEIGGEEVIRSTTDGDKGDLNNDSDSDHSDYFSDCERDDLA